MQGEVLLSGNIPLPLFPLGRTSPLPLPDAAEAVLELIRLDALIDALAKLGPSLATYRQ